MLNYQIHKLTNLLQFFPKDKLLEPLPLCIDLYRIQTLAFSHKPRISAHNTFPPIRKNKYDATEISIFFIAIFYFI